MGEITHQQFAEGRGKSAQIRVKKNIIIGIDETLDLIKMTLIRTKKDFSYNVVYF